MKIWSRNFRKLFEFSIFWFEINSKVPRKSTKSHTNELLIQHNMTCPKIFNENSIVTLLLK